MTIFERVRQLNFPLGEYVVVGGATEAHGLRPANDIDIIAAPPLFARLIQAGWRVCDCAKCQLIDKQMLKGEGVDVISDFSWGDSYHIDTELLINTADIIEGLPFVKLQELLKWKLAAARPKDLVDAASIEAYLAKRSPTSIRVDSFAKVIREK